MKVTIKVLKFVAASIAYFVVAYFVMIALAVECGYGEIPCKAAWRYFVVGVIVFYGLLSFVYWFRYWRRLRHRKG